MSGAARAVAIAAAAAALAVVTSTPVAAGMAEVEPSLALEAQDAFAVLGGELRARIRVAAEREDLSISVVAHQSLITRSAFDRTLTDQGLGSVLSQVVVDLGDLPVTPDGSRDLVVPLVAPGQARTSTMLAVRTQGVYPLAIELRDDQDRTLDRFVSYLMAVRSGADGQPVPLENQLGVAWVWPLAAAPAYAADGRLRAGLVPELAPTGRLGRQAAAMAAAPGLPLTLVPAPETLDAWTSLGQDRLALSHGASAISRAPGNQPVLAGPYVPLDLPSLLRNGLGAAVDAEYAAGSAALDRLYGDGLDRRIALARPVDLATLQYLRSRGVERVIVDEDALEPSTTRLTVAAPFALEDTDLDGAVPMIAVSNDARLARLLSGDGPPALRAQQLLAGLSVVALESPAETRAVVVANTLDADPSEALLDALVSALMTHPWLEPTTVATVFDTIAAEDDARALRPFEPAAPPVSAAAFAATASRVAGFSNLVGPDQPKVVLAERLLLTSLSMMHRRGARGGGGAADLAGAERVVTSFLDRIRVPPPGTITLTARDGTIPITFRNDTGRSVRILVRLSGRNVVFPDGSTRAVDLAPRNTTVSFPVETRSSGTFPLDMAVSSTDGSLLIADARFRVRSTAFSGVGLGLTVGAGVFLVVWWGLHIRRRRVSRAVPPPS